MEYLWFVVVVAAVGSLVYLGYDRIASSSSASQGNLITVRNLVIVVAVMLVGGILLLCIAGGLRQIGIGGIGGSTEQELVDGIFAIGVFLILIPMMGLFLFYIGYQAKESMPWLFPEGKVESSASVLPDEDLSDDQKSEQTPVARLVSGGDNSTTHQMTVECPHCGNTLNVSKKFAGVKGACKKCSKNIMIPSELDSLTSRKPFKYRKGRLPTWMGFKFPSWATSAMYVFYLTVFGLIMWYFFPD